MKFLRSLRDRFLKKPSPKSPPRLLYWPYYFDFWHQIVPYERQGEDPYRGYDNPIPPPGTCPWCGAPPGEGCDTGLHA